MAMRHGGRWRDEFPENAAFVIAQLLAAPIREPSGRRRRVDRTGSGGLLHLDEYGAKGAVAGPFFDVRHAFQLKRSVPRGRMDGPPLAALRDDRPIAIRVVDTGEIVRMPMQRILLLQPRDVPYEHAVVLEQLGGSGARIGR